MAMPFFADEDLSPLFDSFAVETCICEDEDELLVTYIDAPIEDQPVLEALLDEGFTWEEAMGLVCYREQLYDVPEMMERVQSDPHLGFAKWLCEQGRFSEGLEEATYSLGAASF